MQEDKGGAGIEFRNWCAVLGADSRLTPGLRASYRSTIGDFVRFCQERQSPATVTLAREYIELARLERPPSPARLQEWKDGLNWFFRQGKAPLSPAGLSGTPPLAKSDLGRVDWEQRLIERIRVLRFSWRTEQTYRGWAWRLARFLGERPMASAKGEDLRAFCR